MCGIVFFYSMKKRSIYVFYKYLLRTNTGAHPLYWGLRATEKYKTALLIAFKVNNGY